MEARNGSGAADSPTGRVLSFPTRGESIYVFQAGLRRIAYDRTFTRSMYRVLFGALAYTEGGNYLYCSAAELARRMGMRYDTCRRAWNQLIDKGWLWVIRNGRGQIVSYRLSPWLCWKGDIGRVRQARVQAAYQRRLVRAAAAIGEV